MRPHIVLALLAAAGAATPERHLRRARRGNAVFNLLEFGAKPDNCTLNTAAFNAAVAAVAAAGGGTLEVPSGVFRTAPFNLTSHMTLLMQPGAVIRAPSAEQLGGGPAFPLWPILPALPSYGTGRDHAGEPRRTSLLHGANLTDVVLTSADPKNVGVIDGVGEPWWACHCATHSVNPLGDCRIKYDPPCQRAETETFTRGHLIELMYSSEIEISHLHLRDAPFWTVHPYACQRVVVRDVQISAPTYSPNTDGVDPDSCEDVLIDGLTYSGGDDAIAIKSGWDCFGVAAGWPTRGVLVRNLDVVATPHAAAVAIGSEMSGGIANVTVLDSVVRRARTGVNIKYSRTRGGYLTDIRVSNMQLGRIARPPPPPPSPASSSSHSSAPGPRPEEEGCGVAFAVSGLYGAINPSCAHHPTLPTEVSRISFRNVRQMSGTHVDALFDIAGGDSPITELELVDVHLSAAAVGACANVSGSYIDAPGADGCDGLRPG